MGEFEQGMGGGGNPSLHPKTEKDSQNEERLRGTMVNGGSNRSFILGNNALTVTPLFL